MSEAQKRYVDVNSCDRGVAANDKAITRWKRFQLVGGILLALGAVLVAIAVNEYSHFDLTGMATVAAIGVTSAAIGTVPYAIGKYMLERFRFDNLNYRLAIHFMREMGIKNAEKVLAQDSRFLEAFKEIRYAVTAKQAADGGTAVNEQTVTRLSYRVASLMLRDEESLALKPLLLSLIAGGADLDYDTLSEVMNRKIEGSPNSRTYASSRP